MSHEEILYLAIAFLVGLFVREFLPSYLREKGKNLATKEDVEKITHSVESVKSDYAVLLEEVRNKNQLRVAALEKRLEVHQKAFTTWLELSRAVHTPEIHQKVMACQEFWRQNCIYLESSVRDAFVAAYHAASNHSRLLDQYRGANNPEGTELVKANFSTIMAWGTSSFQQWNSLHSLKRN